jgi:hypothetical protein
MQLRKIGMCKVMMDKAMEDGFNTGMINVLTRSNLGKHIMTQNGL